MINMSHQEEGTRITEGREQTNILHDILVYNLPHLMVFWILQGLCAVNDSLPDKHCIVGAGVDKARDIFLLAN